MRNRGDYESQMLVDGNSLEIADESIMQIH